MNAISKPGIYDIPAEVYHADPCPTPSLSSSIAKVLSERTPWHAWNEHPRLNPDYQPEYSRAMEFGSVAHAVMLRDTRELRIIKAQNYNSQAAQVARDMARKSGLVPVLEPHFERAVRMVEMGRAQIAASEDNRGAFTNGKPERTLIWKERVGKGKFIWCRVRLDWLPDDYQTNAGTIFPDYKSTERSAAPEDWGHSFQSLGNEIQDAFYRRAIKAVLGVHYEPRFLFYVQEQHPPFALCVYGADPALKHEADAEVERAIQLWGECIHSGEWPGYPKHTVWISPKPWIETRRQQRLAYEAELPSAELKKRMILWQSPLEKKRK